MSSNKDMKKILGALVIGIAATSVAGQPESVLNISALMRLFLGLIGWVPMAYVLSSMG